MNQLTVELTAPQQRFFLAKKRYVAFVGGFGSGKSEALFVKMLYDKFMFPDVNLLYGAPTYSLIRDIAHDRLCAMLDQCPVKYKLNRAEQILEIENYGKILFRTLDSPERLVGFEIYRAYIDEIDTLRMTQAADAWNKLLGRCRQKSNIKQHISEPTNQIFVATTPEGFRFTYDRWVKRKTSEYQLINAPTRSNPHLPDGYIESLKSSYPAELIDAYLEGKFVNLTSKTVYSSYIRSENDTNLTIDDAKHLILHIGMDFNVQNMNATISIILDEKVYTIAEVTGVDHTPAMINTLKEIFPNHFPNKIIIYPDAYADARKTADIASRTDHSLLREAGLTLDVPNGNPPIKDRVQAVNHMFCDGNGIRRMFINSNTCQSYVLALEQQTYDPNGMPEKSKTDNIDDINDAHGYFVHRKFPIIREVFEVQRMQNY